MTTLVEFFTQVAALIQAGADGGLGAWAYLLLGVSVAVEGPIATLLGGAAASTGHLNLLAVLIVATLANTLNDTFWYGVGYVGGVKRVEKVGRLVGVKRGHLDGLQRTIQQHTIKVLLLAKLSAALVIPSLVSAGIARVPLRRWLPAILVVETLWIGMLALIGFFATEAIGQVEEGLQVVGLLFSAALVTAAVLVIRSRLKARAIAAETQVDGE